MLKVGKLFLVTLLVYLPGNSSNNNLIKVCQRPEYMHEENWLQFDVQNIRYKCWLVKIFWYKYLLIVRCNISSSSHTSHLKLRVYHN